MIAPLVFLIGTTVMRLADPLDDALDDLRISGSVLVHEAYKPPWAVDVPTESRLRRLLGVGPDMRVLPFHLTGRGGFDLSREGETIGRVEAPDLLLLPGGSAHCLSNGDAAQSTALETILSDNNRIGAPKDEPGATELICGAFVLRAAPLNPLLGALPPALKVPAGGAEASPALAGAAAMLAAERGRRSRNGFTAQRLLEVLCAEAIRSFQHSQRTRDADWFRGLGDPKISEVVRHVHADPGADWSVEAPAARVALSPSRFAARFRETMGESVMAYVGRWHLNVACRLLRETESPLDRIAERVGYESVPAFSRAFKAQLGRPPAQWRREKGTAFAKSRKLAE
ncbi:AraC family transcriptional regulator (plasmid) [Methylocystis parvus]|uniref:AraC family transcriptional regulator n=2 Tax=Methylocystis parvus TaxID=134 RepID=A0A6B8MEJ4_9HYPH|nr:AraC family transcriptional regulator [Methylocystis parvus]